MEKKYQVFVSSTYEDLQEERKKVMEALLQMNCFPVGMEYFNASDSSQWEVIKSLIRECDYYVLIVAGRYGSIEEESGKSYTQKEFEYAIEQGVPVISFVHKAPESLPGIKIEQEQIKRNKLEEFKSCVKKKSCKFWINADELASQVVLGLNNEIKIHPRIGWVKADEVSSAEANKELLQLKKEKDYLLSRIKEIDASAPVDIEDLEHGEDKFDITYFHNEAPFDCSCLDVGYHTIEETWNKLFLYLSDSLLTPKSKEQIMEILHSKLNLDDFDTIDDECFQTILIQLMSLGLIETDLLKTDGLYSYWILTPYGRKEMVRLRVRRRNK